MAFDKRQTNIAKGVAILMLIWHHLFSNNSFVLEKVSYLFNINGTTFETFLASFCKVCVAVFLLLSGYGLFKSFEKFSNKYSITNKKSRIKCNLFFVRNHLVGLLFDFWIVYIIFAIMGFFLNHNPVEVYSHSVLYFVIDFFGLSYLLNTPTLNETWWFMSIIIVYYILFLLIVKMFNYSSEVLLAFSFLLIFIPYINLMQLNVWLFSFVLGMYIAKYNLFERINIKLNKISISILFVIFTLTVSLFIRYKIISQSVVFDGLFSVIIILLSYLIISKFKWIGYIFYQLGKYSGYIFMFHTFIFKYYFGNFIYGFNYSILIFGVMVVICIIFAIVISAIKKVCHIDKLENIIISRGLK